jgi:predicted transcriptional regulator
MAKKVSKKKKEVDKVTFVNPIDKDKIAENAHLLPYASSVGGPAIKPTDQGRIKGVAMKAMYEQTDRQMDQIREQVETLISQAKSLQKRKEISEQIYLATINFRPVMGHTYYLYERKTGESLISLVGPEEWGKNPPYIYIATTKLLYDHTWEVLHEAVIDGEP